MASEKEMTQSEQEDLDARSLRRKRPFGEPKLKFIEPKLTKYGGATRITEWQGFFGTFVPDLTPYTLRQ